MDFKLLKEIARPQWVDILSSIRRGQGKPAGEIARDLGVSYMGVKQPCETMVKNGLLEAFRRPRPMGRPERIYRLTAKALGIFPQAGPSLALDLLKAVGEVFGASEPDKLLFTYFQGRAQFYKSKVKGKSVVERATAFAKLREAEGCLSQVAYDKDKGCRIEEYHQPLADLGRAYPILLKAEERMVAQVVGAKVTREQWKQGGQTVQVFYIDTL